MVKKATSDWQLIKTSAEKTKLKIKMEFIFQGITGFVMQPLMKIKLNKIVQETVEDFAHYAENGKPHPRKIKTQNKLTRQ